MNVGDIVIVEYQEILMEAKIAKLKSKDIGWWLWKKNVPGAIVLLPMYTKTIFDKDWEYEERFEWYPLDEIM
jgi:hypothetical protein